MAGTLRALEPRLPAALVSRAARARLRALCALLPAALTRWLYLESRLAARSGRVDLIVAVEAAGVHVIDTSIRLADAAHLPFPPPALPMTPGREVAGRVVQVGSDVDRTWLGERVVAHLGMASGGYSEQVAVAASAVYVLDLTA